jgi:hypothetical protein
MVNDSRRQILEGIATIGAGLIAAWMLPASLASANFLTPEERDFAGAFLLRPISKHAQVISRDMQFVGTKRMAR